MENNFEFLLKQGIPTVLPFSAPRDEVVDHAPARPLTLTKEEQMLAIQNALRYFPQAWHEALIDDFWHELHAYGRIYMYRFRPTYLMKARPIEDYPSRSKAAAGIMLMIQNNLDPQVAQFPHELITYGGNGAVFQNWAQYLLTMKYLSEMTDQQTLHMYSGHPMGLFPSNAYAPRVIITNGMMIPNYSSPQDYEKFNALGVTQYGQMTAGSYMYIGPQGIVHGTTITLMNAFRKLGKSPKGSLFVSAGLGGMSGAQPKAANIVGCVSICAEVNEIAARKRHEQGWVDQLMYDLGELVDAVRKAMSDGVATSFAYVGNVVDLWEYLDEQNLEVAIGTDQTSLHNPFGGGYYPSDLTLEASRELMKVDPDQFVKEVRRTLVNHVDAVNKLVAKGMYFFDYGNAFLLEASRAEADIFDAQGIHFKYSSYVQDILGPMCFDYGFGPFRWVCASGLSEDLAKTDSIAIDVLEELAKVSPDSIKQQMHDNIHWMKHAGEHKMVVGSQARILYADAEGRVLIAEAFNRAVREKQLSAPVILGRDHHDVSGTDSPYRETSNIYDGSAFTADMSIHNVLGDACRGASWVSIHNGGGVGWGEVSNGGFGLVLDGTTEADDKLRNMLFYDVNNGIARRSWARNPGANEAITRAMERRPDLKVTVPYTVDQALLDRLS
ncbi:MAG: urocanate hydratase [Cyclobacteriaceae bacterium]|jgi:urocanate hydratase